ncbi:hypothetical protein A2276_06095 [candidate division WOR-1 bacterium RIFOXYA12_FULL_43_27]|uniref:WbqC-like protein n=1 Tax=candidate division WOR-1 bacterium RIFOXYC2_FULL_46_14 TaxID=1802587 RepID=A0A1F4U380_UNCSA|nr:MAG: hypothetical protein A2276_06095 [candidate division WOR-1 bacterium RIFOXYA12_FULL_43_27]OGC20228.1 MAG: hypothetical protein A2292_04095 [candidate division WOR-1 bacterium RIFOXYB2_FULL_46_45]OGC32033.1 MAG: hypothetical protein A2232_07350 [candidate division WOR-1 bacterium RIFOXYA2_FULL_46_56]OGC39435.1 MAG: hypothetical protein A2438_07715 [candidate division WOR-1 bacterium RIFOXYC2_FULL_46_14]
MKAVIMQPTYLPWIGYFDLMDQSDVFVFLDDVQFEKQSWQSRNRIKTLQGELWLSVPVVKKFPQLLKDVEINNATAWSKTHFKSIVQNYQKAAYFKDLIKDYEMIYETGWSKLAELNIKLIKTIVTRLNLAKKMLFSSELNCTGNRVGRLINICKAVGADTYLSPLGSKGYIDEDNRFEAEGVKLEYQQYTCPQYRQQYGDFIPFMSTIDLLFNEGDRSLQIIRSGREEYRGEDVHNSRK